jgi:hypothetical protein
LAIGLENSDESRVKLVDDATRDKLKKWLNPVDVNTSFQNDLNKRHAGTGEWLFNNCPEFNKWFDGQNRFLWIYGICQLFFQIWMKSSAESSVPPEPVVWVQLEYQL